MLKFVEEKQPDLVRISKLLESCARENAWANRGPLYVMLADKFAAHFGLGASSKVVPCANAGVALEAMSRLLGMKAGRALRWVGSAFSFQNLGRGHFADMQFVDCTMQGLLDLEQLRALDPSSYDGVIIVNPFGLVRDLSAYIAFAKQTGKALLIDNAAGVDSTIPDWPWQAFSLHQTKPYGVGEGGLAIVPTEVAEEFYGLLNYGPVPAHPAAWFNNGKISDISCAFLIDRLELVDQWAPQYHRQAERVVTAAARFGMVTICPPNFSIPAMSWGFVAERPIPAEVVARARHVTLRKYYVPLAAMPSATALYDRLVNIPTHPGMAQLSDAHLDELLQSIVGNRG